MKHVTRIRFAQIALWALVLVVPATAADWTYDYADDFSSNDVESNAYLHSTFWTRDANPLPEPYLQYLENTTGRSLLFMDYADEPARLGLCLPVMTMDTHRIFTGTIKVDVEFPCNETVSQFPTAGKMYCSTSSDGIAWSGPQYLYAGRNTISIASHMGKCYIVFSGVRAAIDNIAVSLRAPAATIRVPADYATIQEAIDAARTGDVVEVAPGTYTGSGNWDIDFGGKRITVRSADGAARTIINCGAPAASSRRGFYFHQSETPDSVLSGFTIRRGRVYGKDIPADPLRWTQNASHPIGGGIYCEFSSPTIAGCVIDDCHAELGGGIGVVGSGPTLINCTIQQCLAGGLGSGGAGGRGAGIALVGESYATITHCEILSNRTYYDGWGAGLYVLHSSATVAGCTFAFSDNFGTGLLRGGGIYCGGDDTDVTFRNCIFSNNQADVGAGILVERTTTALPSVTASNRRCAVAVLNCTIAENALTYSLGSSAAGGINSNGALLTIASSILWGNDGAALTIANAGDASVTYSDIQGSYPGIGNISADPQFASPAGLDYHLKSTGGRYNPQTGEWVNDSSNSPCIDSGDWLESAEHEPPCNGDRINMGAYGGTSEASKSAAYTVFHVAKTGRDWNNGRSQSQAFATIEKAIEAAADGDSILVWPGEYAERLSFEGKAITIRSAADAAVISCPGDYAFSFYMGEGQDSVLANFVIAGCGQAGILCDYGASPTLKNLTIANNAFGILAYKGAKPTIVNCILWDNVDGDLFQCDADYSCIEHTSESMGTGNITSNPLFANAAGGDYHLRSPYGRYVPNSNTWATDTAMSPCIDKGDPFEYPRNERVPNGNRINMGAYGGTAYASKSSGPKCP